MIIDPECIICSKLPPRYVVYMKWGSGLSNRLRIVLGFWHVASIVHAKLLIIWGRDSTCPGSFLDVYQPILHTTFVTNASAAESIIGQAHARGSSILALRTRGDWNLRRIITKYGNADDYHQDEHLVSRLYALLKPIPTLQGRIDAFSLANNISSCVGMHIRRTDMVEKNGTEWWKGVGSDHNDTASTSNMPSSHLSIINDSDDTFLNLVKDHLKANSKQRFFLATDNRATQLKFETADFPQGTIFSAGVIAPPRPESSRDNIVVYRHTSLDRAVMDVHLLARCREFHGSRGSSFSTLVGRLKQASSELHQDGALEERRQS